MTRTAHIIQLSVISFIILSLVWLNTEKKPREYQLVLPQANNILLCSGGAVDLTSDELKNKRDNRKLKRDKI